MLLRNPIDRNQKLDSSLATRYLWISWRISGVYPPKKYRTAYYIYAVISNLIAVLLPISTITNIFFIKGLQLMVENLSLTVTVVTATIKHFILYLYQDHLLRTNIYLKKLDKRSNGHPRDRYHVLFAIRICHIFYLVYNILFTVAAYGFAVIGVRTHQLLFNGWYPDFFNDETKNYHAAFIFQFLAITIYVFQNTNNDMYPQCYVAIMIGHLRALIERIERIGKDDRVSDEDNVDELLACIQDHKNILKYFDCIRPVISRTISQQFIITGFVLCLTGISLTTFASDAAQILFTVIYQIAILVEIFPCCWFVNVLMHESDYLTTAMYSCNWYTQNLKFRKTLIIFMQRSQKTNVILAGNLAPITLQTFLAIIRFSFSMFTLLNNMNE